MKYTYDSTEAWAYGMLELLSTFSARVGMNETGMKRLKELIPEFCDSQNRTHEGHRALEAAYGQFIAQLEHIWEERP